LWRELLKTAKEERGKPMRNPIDTIRQHRAALRAAEAEEFRERAETGRKDKARAVYIAAGGDEFYFEQTWPSLRQRIIEDETVASVKGK